MLRYDFVIVGAGINDRFTDRKRTIDAADFGDCVTIIIAVFGVFVIETNTQTIASYKRAALGVDVSRPVGRISSSTGSFKFRVQDKLTTS